MFGKLFKYDIKDSMRIFLPLWGAVIVLGLINGLTIGLRPNNPICYLIVSRIPKIVFGALIFSMFIIALIIIIKRFYIDLLGEGGYLSFTLPVTESQHIWSKLLSALIMEAGCVIVAVFSASALILIWGKSSFSDLAEAFSEMSVALREYPLSYMIIFEVIILAIVYTCLINLRIFASISIGHLFNKNRGLMSLLAFIATGWVLNGIAAMSVYHAGNYLDAHSESLRNIESISASFNSACIVIAALIVFVLVLDVVLWTITHIILRKKLNIM